MKLPHAENAIIDPAKLDEYLLNPEHERGKHKARVFEAACGITDEHAEVLREALLEAARQGPATLGTLDDFGRRYVIEWKLHGPQGEAAMRTAWMIRTGEDFLRFVTCHIV